MQSVNPPQIINMGVPTDGETIYRYCMEGRLNDLKNWIIQLFSTKELSYLENLLNSVYRPYNFTPLMVAVIYRHTLIVEYLIGLSTDASSHSIRVKLDIGITSPSGGTAYDYAVEEDIRKLLNREIERKNRLDANWQIEGFHETNESAFNFIQIDRRINRHPMIGGNGGYFGGGIYFAFTAKESNQKSLYRQRGFKCRVKLGRSYIISTGDQFQNFRRDICLNQEPFNIPTDVMQKRLLNHGYDSVNATRNNMKDDTDYINNTGDEMVVYSADQVVIEQSYYVEYNKYSQDPNDKSIIIEWRNTNNRIVEYSQIFREKEYKKQPLLLSGLFQIGLIPHPLRNP